MKFRPKHSILSIILFCIVSSFTLEAQSPKKPTVGEIYMDIEKLNFLGTALYIAAHPDDENTRLISHLANAEHAQTYYLSCTRGDGGQNLIGPEIRELLGVIRTQELLAARRTDGGNQMFTRANDFGYSKNAEETIDIWNDDEVKHDVVWAIRNIRPDVIINRFDHRTSGSTHGHHTASAMLSHQMFDKAGDASVYPEQLKYVDTWSPRRLFFNTTWWFYGSRENFDKADKTNLMEIGVGEYFPMIGKSNNEIAALSRSNHKCQGFGSTGSRGNATEWLELLKGDMPATKSNPFEGINTTWSRVKGGDQVQKLMDLLIADFDFTAPDESVSLLMKIRKSIEATGDEHWKIIKLKEVDKLIEACLGMFTEAVANTNTVIPGQEIDVRIEVIKRLSGDVNFKGFSIAPNGLDSMTAVALTDNDGLRYDVKYTIPSDADYTSAYWLREEGSLGMYKVADPKLIGLPQSPRALFVTLNFEIAGQPYSITKELVNKYNHPENGEVYRPIEIVPEISVKFNDRVYVFADTYAKDISVQVEALVANQEGQVSIPLPEGWTSIPALYEFSLAQKGESKNFTFSITPPSNASEFFISPEVQANDRIYSKNLARVDYDHIPLQIIEMPAKAKFTRLEIEKRGNRVAYVMGAGDEIPEALEQIGYGVTLLEPSQLNLATLQKYDALIMGVRAYNKHNTLKFKQEVIFDYVKKGGNFIVQYNTNRGLGDVKMMPYDLNISRDRVTIEGAEVRILEPDHEVLNYPNKISSKDFDGWVQERGLYFPNEWGEEFSAILSSNDPGEPARDGGLLVADYGEGHLVYTGYSWFRELPAGVSGAYRIFANIISLGNDVKP